VLSILTNVSAMTSVQHFNRTGNAVTSSVERLSTGLRINRAADDSSGMLIADSLRSQALGLGQSAMPMMPYPSPLQAYPPQGSISMLRNLPSGMLIFLKRQAICPRFKSSLKQTALH